MKKSALLEQPLPSRITQVDQNSSFHSFADTNFGQRRSFYNSINSAYTKGNLSKGISQSTMLKLKDSTNLKAFPKMRKSYSNESIESCSSENMPNSRISLKNINPPNIQNRLQSDVNKSNKLNSNSWQSKNQIYHNSKINLKQISNIDENDQIDLVDSQKIQKTISENSSSKNEYQKIEEEYECLIPFALPKQFVELNVTIQLDENLITQLSNSRYNYIK